MNQPTHQRDLPRTDTPAKTSKAYVENRLSQKHNRRRPVKRFRTIRSVDFYPEAAC